MMKNRFALISTALAVLGAAFGALSTAARAQSLSGSVYYGPPPGPVYVEPQPVYVEPQPVYVYPPTYVYPAPTYYYAPPPTYYAAPPVVYAPPVYAAPLFSATFDFGGRGHRRH